MRNENNIRLFSIRLAIAFPSNPHILDRFSANRRVAREFENLPHDQIILLSKGRADPEPKHQHACRLKTLYCAFLLSTQGLAPRLRRPPMHFTMRRSAPERHGAVHSRVRREVKRRSLQPGSCTSWLPAPARWTRPAQDASLLQAHLDALASCHGTAWVSVRARGRRRSGSPSQAPR